MDNKFLLFLLVVPVVLAGCIGQTAPTVGVGNGVIITSFTPEFDEVFGNDEVAFTVLVQNVGERVARNVKAQMFGVWEDVAEKSVNPSELAAANPAQNIVGQEGFVEFGLTAPEVANDITYTASVRVTYDYTSVSDSVIKFVGREFSKTTDEKSSVTSTKTTGGPFIITPRGNIPLISSQTEVTVQFDIQNVGGGRAKVGEELDRVTLLRAEADGFSIDCGVTDTIRLIAGKSKILSCKIPVTADETIEQTKTISIKLEYEYFVDSSTSIKVLRTEETL